MSKVFDFVRGSLVTPGSDKRTPFDLCYAYPEVDAADKLDSVVSTIPSTNPRKSCDVKSLVEDGLYADSAEPLTKTVVKPYQLNQSDANKSGQEKYSRNLEIAIREVKIHPNQTTASGNLDSTIKVNYVALLYKKKIICKISKPFDRQLYKLLLSDPPDSANLSIQVQAHDGSSSILPLPLPRHTVKNNRIEIDFSISTVDGVVHSGTVTCTFSLMVSRQTESSMMNLSRFYAPTSDPNDPRNSAFICRSKTDKTSKNVNYFSLDHPALRFIDKDNPLQPPRSTVTKKTQFKEVENVIIEHASFTHGNISIKQWFQARHPLRPSSSTYSHKLRRGKKELLVITVLRGVEIPVREESALVQPLLEIEWGDMVHVTTPADGPVPIWHQTFHFEVPEQSEDQSVKLRLFDQHPVWGLQWLGEASIPMENYRDYQELERWVGLSPLSSPVLTLGYVQPSPGLSYTRFYILMKMEQPGNPRPRNNGSVDALSRAIQRCAMVPYKLERIDNPLDASRLAMLLPSLPLRYGPLTPKQALSLNKVDHFGRAALLASLLRGLDMQSAVILGSSQTRKCAAYVLTIDEQMGTVIWNPENGEHYNPGDNRCSLVKVFRLISHQNIWENTQQNTSPGILKYEIKSSKDWRPVGRGNEANDSRPAQILELNNELKDEPAVDLADDIEQYLKSKLSEWRSSESATTIWNRHAITILRGFLSKLKDFGKGQPDKKEIKQLCRAYYTHGFILNLRHSSNEELAEQIRSTKIHKTSGPVEFALACHVQRYIGNAHSLWIAVLVLRTRD